MKEFKSPIKLPSGSETKMCYYPFKLDTYGCGCSHNCLYCYAKSTLHFRKLWDEKNPRISNLDTIKKVFESGKNIHIKNRIPIRLGGMTDCFANDEGNLKITEQVINYLNSIDYPYLILTKNKLVADYSSILNKENCIVQITITTKYDDLAKIFEEGSSSSTERLAAGKKLSDLGFYVAARINPLFPTHKDGFFSAPNIKDHGDFKYFNYFTFDLAELIADNGFKCIIAGFLRLSIWNIRWIKEKTGENLLWLFNPKNKEFGAYYFSVEEIKKYYEHINNICKEKGIEFTVCYDIDSHYQTFKYLWANQDDCCNNIGKVKGFENKFNLLK